ncbi:MAG: DUF6325 family protein [Dehalococcoidia bacterium]
MSIGPVELVVIKFPGNQFKGEIAPALTELVENGIIRIIDILFVMKDENGTVEMAEINDLAADDYTVFDPIVQDVTGMLSPDDVQFFSESMEPNSSAALMLFENAWATRFRDAVLNAKGELILNERIPRAVIEELTQAEAVAGV